MTDTPPSDELHPGGARSSEHPSAKPQRASGYTPEILGLVQRTCLYVATVLGDLLEEGITIVGGLAPHLLVPQAAIANPTDRHIGTRDLDLGFSLSVLDDEQYTEISDRLRRAGFHPDRNNDQNPTRQRWVIGDGTGMPVAVDFLIPPVHGGPAAGKPFALEDDFAATVTPGLALAFRDRIAVVLDGYTVKDEWARRTVWVCGPGAFVVLKARAFRIRGEGKDAYDLYYVLRHYGSSVADVADHLRPLADDGVAREALGWLREDFSRVDAVGPRRVAAFLESTDDDALRADARAFVLDLLDRCDSQGPG